MFLGGGPRMGIRVPFVLSLFGYNSERHNLPLASLLETSYRIIVGNK